jgi:glyoxylase-like metal-dependent hydrolase (beta-lactamase superfamily II)
MSGSRVTATRIEFEVDWPPGHVACYVLSGEEPALVDAGTPTGEAEWSVGEPDRTLREGLATAGLGFADLEHLVITHPHVDHVGQVPAVLSAADPTVHVPAGVRERFGRDDDALEDRVRRNAQAAGVEGDLLSEAVDSAVDSLERDRGLCPPDAVDHWVEDGERFTVGGRELEAVHAPGHQADHLCYLTDLEGERALLAGDMAMEPFRAVAIHDGLDDGVSEAFGAFYGALDRLESLAVDRVYPGHGAVHDGFDRVIPRDRGSLDRRLAGVREAVADGHRTVAAVAARAAGDRPVRYLLPEVYAAILHLVEAGELIERTEEGVGRYHLA